MIDDTPLPDSGANRRENFRIDNVLPISIRKIENEILPTAHVIPVAANNSSTGTWEESLNLNSGEFDSSFALMLIEVNAKLDLLLEAQHLPNKAAKESDPARLSMNQILLQINLKLEHLLSANHLTRSEDKLQISTVSLSASGIKLKTNVELALGDLVEVRMFMKISKPFWVVVGGSVVRSTPLPTGQHEVAIHFADMDEAVRDEISRYALMDQKRQIMARRGIRA